MLNTAFPPWPSFTSEEAAAVQQVLLSNKVNYWTGTECRACEKEFATWAGVPHTVVLAEGTLAEQHGLKVIEDCAQAHGARYKGRKMHQAAQVLSAASLRGAMQP